MIALFRVLPSRLSLMDMLKEKRKNNYIDLECYNRILFMLFCREVIYKYFIVIRNEKKKDGHGH